MKTALSELPARIKRLREGAGLAQGELARMTGLTQAQISAYEVGRSLPGLESALALSTALGTTVAALIDQAEPVSAPPRPPTRHEMAAWMIEAVGIEGFPLQRCKEVLLEGNYRKSV